MNDDFISDKTPLLFEDNDMKENNTVVRQGNNFVKDEQLVGSQVSDIVVIFVVSFDTRSGNMVEWCHPSNINLDGVEFKAMASGAHTVKTDFIYFKQDHYFGLSCFENMPVQSDIERGARMKSVGILSKSYKSLAHHFKFLHTQVRIILENPGSYNQLENYFNAIKQPRGISTEEYDSVSDVDSIFTLHNSTMSQDQNDVDSLKHSINFFGVDIFKIWKLVLLQKRILFFSPPPIGLICNRVYCASLMYDHLVPGIQEINRPIFCVNLNDSEMLQKLQSYIACTSEKFFQFKQDLYDVYVDNQNIKLVGRLDNKVCTSASDKLNFQHLKAISERQSSSTTNFCNSNYFQKYFMERNTKLFSMLLNCSCSDSRLLTSKQIQAVGLDPSSDRKFIMAIIDLYGFDVVYVVDNYCCPFCPL